MELLGKQTIIYLLNPSSIAECVILEMISQQLQADILRLIDK